MVLYPKIERLLKTIAITLFILGAITIIVGVANPIETFLGYHSHDASLGILMVVNALWMYVWVKTK